MTKNIGKELVTKLSRVTRALDEATDIKGTLGVTDPDTGNTTYAVPGQPGYVYVTLQDGSVSKALNFGQGSVPVVGVPVRLKSGPHGLEVVGYQKRKAIEGLDSAAVSRIGTGTHSHEPGFGNEDMVSNTRIVDGRVWYRGVTFSDGPFTVYVNSFWYKWNGADYQWTGGTIDLSSYMPGAGLQRWVKLSFDPSTASLVASAGSTESYFATLADSDLLAISATNIYPLAGVQISAAFTDLTSATIRDARVWNSDLGFVPNGGSAIDVLHNPVQALADSNINIASPGASIDGYSLNAGDRVLLTNQSSGSQNGLMVWHGAAVAMTRPTDFPSGSTIAAFHGVTVDVEHGNTYADQRWRLTTTGAITIDTTAQSWKVTRAVLPINGSATDRAIATWGTGGTSLRNNANTNIDSSGNLKANSFVEPTSTTLTISSSAVTITQGYHLIESSSGTTDNLATINGGVSGQSLIIQADSDDTITVKNGTGNIFLNGGADFVLSGHKSLILFYDGSNWTDGSGIVSGGGSPLTTAGDLYVYGATNTRQPIGGNHAVLMVDTALTTKLAYSDSETSAILLPVGTTGQEPTGANGLIRFNSTTGRKEWWENSAWQNAVRLSGDTMTGNLTAPGGLFTELGVGNAAALNANAPLSLTHSVTDITATLNGVLSTVTHTMTANNNFSVRGFHSILTINNGGFNVTDDISSINYNIETDINGSGTVSSIAGVNIGHHISAATITTAYGLFMSSPTLASGASIITSYGIYLSAVTNGTTNYAIYTNGGKHYFADTLQLAPPTQSVNQGFGFGLSVTHNTAVSAVYGSEVTAIASNTSGTMTNLYTNFVQAFYGGTSAASPAITNLYGTYARNGISGVSPTGTITNSAGFVIDALSGQATGTPVITVTNNYGLLVGDIGLAPSGVTITNAKAIEVANQTGSGYALHTNKGHVGFGADVTIIGSIDAIQLRVAGNGTQTNDIFRVDNSSFVKLMTASNTGLVSIFGRDSATATVLNTLIASHDSSGTPAANFGTGVVIQGQDSTTADQQMARWRAYWSTATHASRATIVIYSANDSTGERDVIGIGANGSAAILGFYPTAAAAPIAQPTTAIAAATFVANTSGIANDTATWDGYTVGQVVKALRNLGLLA